ncbi:ubiE/COQ5 methyltransferase [Xylariales sp. AK1849]|nr:ubiE/COQ5 methyltransferase [Xylariales sp. AK1849]
MDGTQIYKQVNDHYTSASQSSDAKYSLSIAKAFGYSEEDLASTPADANLGLSCGNPIAIAGLREGETVIDLGSGAGFDVFQAATKVGGNGRVIGVDMNKEMLAKANKIKDDLGRENVQFVESRITSIDLPSSYADVVISNCVINLVPKEEKHRVFEEIFRLLKPGGRVAVSDILTKGPLPERVRNDVALYVGCIAGASEVGEYEEYLRMAGFEEILISDTKSNLNVYREANGDTGADGCCGPKSLSCCEPAQPKSKTTSDATIGEYGDLNQWAGSYKIFAVKSQ